MAACAVSITFWPEADMAVDAAQLRLCEIAEALVSGRESGPGKEHRLHRTADSAFL